ncbi:MAG: RluA family pseudouridine synthase [Lentisphaeria bacterium]
MPDDPQDATPAAPEPERLLVPAAAAGERLDAFLARCRPERSRAFYQRLIREGCLLRNGRPGRPSELLRADDLLLLSVPPEPNFELKGEPVAFGVLAEDADVLVINKPPGLVVHPAKGNWTGTLVNGLLAHDGEEFGAMVDDGLRPGIVHRLDKDTSGVMVVAKNAVAAEALRRSFKEHAVEKTYLALVLGEFGAATGTIVAPIGRHPKDRKRMAVVEDGKPAESRYSVLAAAAGVTLLAVRILTGRTHQIRVHFSHLRHPLLGDAVYGGRPPAVGLNPPPARQMLHAWKLAFPHPRTGVRHSFQAPPPADFQAVLRALGMPDFSAPAEASPPLPAGDGHA